MGAALRYAATSRGFSSATRHFVHRAVGCCAARGRSVFSGDGAVHRAAVFGVRTAGRVATTPCLDAQTNHDASAFVGFDHDGASSAVRALAADIAGVECVPRISQFVAAR